MNKIPYGGQSLPVNEAAEALSFDFYRVRKGGAFGTQIAPVGGGETTYL
jgi:hypothetical protein